MNILIIFDSKFGNTEKIARAMGDALEKANNVKALRVTESLVVDLSDIELLIVGSPTNGGQPAPMAKAFISNLPEGVLKGKKAAAFDTGSTPDGEGFFGKKFIKLFGYAAPRTAKMLTNKGANVLTFETFFVKGMEGPIIDGEIERAQKWAQDLLSK